jgi:NAD(P)H-dependent FMN reductase
MKALALLGTYRENGTIDTAAQALLEGAAEAGAETRRILLAEQQIGYCRNCRFCTQEPGDQPGTCVQRDDLVTVLEELGDTDLLVLGAPVNNMTATAVTRTFMERLVCLYHWPWGGMKVTRRQWLPLGQLKVVLMTSSAAPSPLGRLIIPVLRQLREVAHALNGEVVATRWYGGAGLQPRPELPQSRLDDARQLGRRVAAGRLPWLRRRDLRYEARRIRRKLTRGQRKQKSGSRET